MGTTYIQCFPFYPKHTVESVCVCVFSERGDKVPVMRRVVETTSVILHHVTHSNNHSIMKRAVQQVRRKQRDAELLQQSLRKLNGLTRQHLPVSIAHSLVVALESVQVMDDRGLFRYNLLLIRLDRTG